MATTGLIAIGKGRGGFWSWLQTHQFEHDRVARATKTSRIILDPFDPSSRQAQLVWLQDHQRAHDQVNQHFNIAGADLSQLNFEDEKELESWVDLNYLEHNQWNSSIPN